MNVYIGWDSREEDAYKVADFSLKKHFKSPRIAFVKMLWQGL